MPSVDAVDPEVSRAACTVVLVASCVGPYSGRTQGKPTIYAFAILTVFFFDIVTSFACLPVSYTFNLIIRVEIRAIQRWKYFKVSIYLVY
jgi:hypothetical protein